MRKLIYVFILLLLSMSGCRDKEEVIITFDKVFFEEIADRNWYAYKIEANNTIFYPSCVPIPTGVEYINFSLDNTFVIGDVCKNEIYYDGTWEFVDINDSNVIIRPEDGFPLNRLDIRKFKGENYINVYIIDDNDLLVVHYVMSLTYH